MLQLDALAFGVLKLNKGRGVVMHLFLCFWNDHLDQALIVIYTIENATLTNT